MDKIDFIPLIELPTLKGAQSNIVPRGTSFTNTKEWDLYQENELKKNYIDIPRPIATGIYQYRLFDIKVEDLRTIIHPSPLITKNQERITIFCDDNDEPFFPYFSKNKIELDYQTTKKALIILLNQLHFFSEKLESLAVEFKQKNPSFAERKKLAIRSAKKKESFRLESSPQ